MEDKTTDAVNALKAHLAINVKDVGRSIDFYRRMLGIEPSKVRRGYAKFDVQNPPLNLTLNERPFGERGALSHLGIQVGSTEDVLRTRERWAAAGLVTRDEMETNCCFAVQDKTWVRDPDGNEWEAFVVLEDDLAETTLCCTTGHPDAAAEAQGAGACSTGAGAGATTNATITTTTTKATTEAAGGVETSAGGVEASACCDATASATRAATNAATGCCATEATPVGISR